MVIVELNKLGNRNICRLYWEMNLILCFYNIFFYTNYVFLYVLVILFYIKLIGIF